MGDRWSSLIRRTRALWLSLLLASALPAQPAFAQTHATYSAGSAAEALQVVLDANIRPGGPLSGDGATIAGVLAGQSLTFPVSSSSGAFSLRSLSTLTPTPIHVSTGGGFGSMFGERADTNGRGRWSVSVAYQRKQWSSISGISLDADGIRARAVYREDLPQGVAGSLDDFSASIRYETSIWSSAVNYGITHWADIGVSMPWITADVDGIKRRVLTEVGQMPRTLHEQRVVGRSSGWGDTSLRTKVRLFPLPGPAADESQPIRDEQKRTSRGIFGVALGFDVRLPTGSTARLYLDCSAPPCEGGPIQEVPDLGLGAVTTKGLVIVSATRGRWSAYMNASYMWVPSYPCDERFSRTGRCKGAIFEHDTVNNMPDAKNQNISDEGVVTTGSTFEVLPYRLSTSFDLITRTLVRAGRLYRGPARAIVRSTLSPSVTTSIESEPGDVTPVVGVLGVKFGFMRTWVVAGSVLFPLNNEGLQPRTSWLVGIERALGRPTITRATSR